MAGAFSGIEFGSRLAKKRRCIPGVFQVCCRMRHGACRREFELGAGSLQPGQGVAQLLPTGLQNVVL